MIGDKIEKRNETIWKNTCNNRDSIGFVISLS